MTRDREVTQSVSHSSNTDWPWPVSGEEFAFANTHLLVKEFELFEPETLGEALVTLSEAPDETKVLAGGTDLLVQMKMERLAPTRLVSLARIPGLKLIQSDNGVLIGSTATLREVESRTDIRRNYTAVAEACHGFSTMQIMTMGTLGGNLCNASPAADSAPALLAFDAYVHLVSGVGTRKVKLEDFFVGPGRTVLKNHEVLESIHLAAPTEPSGSAFLKLGRVAADISKVCVATRLVRDGDEVVECRIALGSVAPTPVRARQAEAVLHGRKLTNSLLDEVIKCVTSDIQPISDVRSTADYRVGSAQVLVRDALQLAWARAGGDNLG